MLICANLIKHAFTNSQIVRAEASAIETPARHLRAFEARCPCKRSGSSQETRVIERLFPAASFVKQPAAGQTRTLSPRASWRVRAPGGARARPLFRRACARGTRQIAGRHIFRQPRQPRTIIIEQVKEALEDAPAKTIWCCERGLNSRPLPYQGSALPLSYRSRRWRGFCHIEPASARPRQRRVERPHRRLFRTWPCHNVGYPLIARWRVAGRRRDDERQDAFTKKG